MGVGLGLVFRFGGTTGGTDLAAAIVNKFIPGFTVGTILMAIDFFVVLVAGLVFKQPEISLYSIISLFTSIKMLDFVQEGLGYAKAFYIISNQPEEISRQVIKELDRGVTALSGKGMYTMEERDVLLCVVQRSQVNRLKEIVQSIDPKAFVIPVSYTHLTSISYGRKFICQRESTIATLPVGYADGYSRMLTGKAQVLIKGKRVPVVGAICMDQCMIDITDVPDVNLGDEVILFGEGLPVEELADQLGTISYEILCMINKRVPRIYRRNEEIIEIKSSIVSH